MLSAARRSHDESGDQRNRHALPGVTLPKGGGALRGIGEKFVAQPASGTGTMSVPLTVSPGRDGFTPQLNLTYDSGGGNGPFGLGWQLDLPAITRKTETGLPQYHDAQESDTFILSGFEDLVPVCADDGQRHVDTDSVPGYIIHRFRPRVEGLYARIERWTRVTDGDVHWRSISSENTLSVYGYDANSRIVDPADPTRIFSWLICETRDAKGNAIAYEYKAEDGVGVDVTQAHEQHRGEATGQQRTANRYPKRIRYGNRTPLLNNDGERPHVVTPAQWQDAGWMFEVVFDYGEHPLDQPTPHDVGAWRCRRDPFSVYRAGFEVRTYRLCQRVLLFHHFPTELGVGPDCLVRSTDFAYSEPPLPMPKSGAPAMHAATHAKSTTLTSVTYHGYKQDGDRYLKELLPPLTFAYSEAAIDPTVRELDEESAANLPEGLHGRYNWVDLDGEGISGILLEDAGAWYYKPNWGEGRLGPLQVVDEHPSYADLANGRQQWLDVNGDGRLELASFHGTMPGYAQRSEAGSWKPHRTFTHLPTIDWHDPNLRFIDLNGDGLADLMIANDEVITWYPSLGTEGFGEARRGEAPDDDPDGPRRLFADRTQSIHLADMSGDGLADIVRIRNGDICYWPNLGYGRFGRRVVMDGAPTFDHPEQFDQQRIRLADIDGSGTADILYLGRDGVEIYFNAAGNTWSPAHPLCAFPQVDDVSAVTTVDLLGNGTACLVWSSPLPDHAGRALRYIDLMGGQKPYLLVKIDNNLGAETHVHYAPSTRFYLADKAAGKPWQTKLPFPVHVVERVETYDHISRNRFVTRYAYHHGYYDGMEREFRGFGLVEQWDTEAFGAFGAAKGELPQGDNEMQMSHVPPAYTQTWYHTGAPDLQTPAPAGATDLSATEASEAWRALKGKMLRQEVYGLDGTPQADTPYTVAAYTYTVQCLQRRGGNRHGVFAVTPRSRITKHIERQADDPRTAHEMTLETDAYGNVLKSAAIAYGRHQVDPALAPGDQARQATPRIIYTETTFTHTIDSPTAYRTPLPCEQRTYELTGYTPTGPDGKFQLDDFVTGPTEHDSSAAVHLRLDREIPHEGEPAGGRERRLIAQQRTLYRPDDCGAATQDATALLPLGTVEPSALPGESYDLAFTPGLLNTTFQRPGDDGGDAESLLPDPTNVLRGDGPDRGGYVDLDGDGHWWIPSGRIFYHPDPGATALAEWEYARQHFFLPHRYRTAFHTEALPAEHIVRFDAYNLLPLETVDAVGNRTTAGERDADGNITKSGNDYRVLQPSLVMDPNCNRTAIALDAFGRVVATAVMGKPGEAVGDTLDGLNVRLSEAEMLAHFAQPLTASDTLLQGATTRIVYDLFAYNRTRHDVQPQPSVTWTLQRERHRADTGASTDHRTLHRLNYSDGFERVIQEKTLAQPGTSHPDGVQEEVRWIGSGWTVFNNKGNPVREHEPFFTATHRFEFAQRIGVSDIRFYDPMGREVVTLRPDHTFEKRIFGAWGEHTWDANDTVLLDPRTDPDVGGMVAPYFAALEAESAVEPTWYEARIGGAIGAPAQAAAEKTAKHAGTPTVTHTDPQGHPLAHVQYSEAAGEPYCTRIVCDVAGRERQVIDALGRMVTQHVYDLAGRKIRRASLDAGTRWILPNAAGEPLRKWDARRQRFRYTYDAARRLSETYLQKAGEAERLIERVMYGEQVAAAEANNLRSQVYQVWDQAGQLTHARYDFKGNLIEVRRRLAQNYRETLNWSAVPALETNDYCVRTRFDALNRPIERHLPDESVLRMAYHLTGHVARIEGNLQGERDAGDRVWIPFVERITYDAKGQRQTIRYGNGVETTYTYDPATFRLNKLETRRPKGTYPGDAPDPPVSAWPGRDVQQLHYTYDPVGNITHIHDAAQQTIFFRNRRVDPSAEYTYDALYRLVIAEGREHLGQQGTSAGPRPTDAWGTLFTGHAQPGDGGAMGRYTERYVYDAVGNILSMQHRGSDPEHTGWTQRYHYEAPSTIEPNQQGNRLSQTDVGGVKVAYDYSGSAGQHGNITSMAHLQRMDWDFRDQLRATAQQRVTGDAVPETTWYVYDANGERIRKVTERAARIGDTPTRKSERIYLGGFEIYREFASDGMTATATRETVHITDGTERYAIVESRPAGEEGSPSRLMRYQLGNHLGSASIELDNHARIISYEEYTPFGATSYQAVHPAIQVAAKRYRYTGKERDEESGFYYHGARYYAPWLGRWLSCDPLLHDYPRWSPYAYAFNHPVNYVDPDGREPDEPNPAPRVIELPAQTVERTPRRNIDSVAYSFDETSKTHYIRQLSLSVRGWTTAAGQQVVDVQRESTITSMRKVLREDGRYDIVEETVQHADHYQNVYDLKPLRYFDPFEGHTEMLVPQHSRTVDLGSHSEILEEADRAYGHFDTMRLAERELRSFIDTHDVGDNLITNKKALDNYLDAIGAGASLVGLGLLGLARLGMMAPQVRSAATVVTIVGGATVSGNYLHDQYREWKINFPIVLSYDDYTTGSD